MKGHIKKKTKKRIVLASVAVLAAAAVTLVSAAVVKAQKKPAGSGEISIEVEAVESEPEVQSFTAEVDKGAGIDLEGELKPEIDDIIDDIKERCGGDWSVYVYIPSTESVLSINQTKMQAASVIKLFIMGAVYENYDELSQWYYADDIPEIIESMITVSSNENADLLVTMLGHGDSAEGRRIVNEYCSGLGLENTVMDRMMGDTNDVYDNYTTTEDTAKFLCMILKGELPYSNDMMKYLTKQTRKNKIPEGVPENVPTANKTGELDDVENDAAIIFAAKPYILCVMSDGVNDYQPPIDAITDISTVTYNYIAPKLAGE